MTSMLQVLQIAGLVFLLQAQVVKSGGPPLTCDNDQYTILAGMGDVTFPKTNFIPLNVSPPAIPVLIDNGSVLVAASRYLCDGVACGKVVVSGKQNILIKKGFSTLVTNIINYLLPADDLRNICVLPGLNDKVLSRLSELYNDTCYNVVSVTDVLTEVKDCAVIIASASVVYTEDEDSAILDAVCNGAGLLVVGKRGANNDLTTNVGITFRTERAKSSGVNINLVPIPPQQCLLGVLDSEETPCNITSNSELATVPTEGIGVAYYGAGRVSVVGNQAILTNPDLFSRNSDYIQRLLAFTSQSKQYCNCSLGCFSRCTTFEQFSSNYANEFNVTLPVVEITEACGTCCVGLNLRDVDSIDAEGLYAYVRDGGCLITTCRNSRRYDTVAINAFLGPFGLQVALE